MLMGVTSRELGALRVPLIMVPDTSVARVVHTRCRVPFACVARLAACRSRVSRVVRVLSRLCPRVAHIVFARRASLIRLA
jgi:hypothetical protein